MERIELKHLAPYLAYNLRVYKIGRTPLLLTVNNYNTLIDNQEWKPILINLSDLTKEIEVNGEKFKPLERLTQIMGVEGMNVLRSDLSIKVLYSKQFIDMDFTSYLGAIQKLFEWHFDVFGLIEKGLAIDMNTLNK